VKVSVKKYGRAEAGVKSGDLDSDLLARFELMLAPDLPVGREHGSLARLAHLRAARQIYIHLDNTNPMLRKDSSERHAVEATVWEVAHDGIEVALFRCSPRSSRCRLRRRSRSRFRPRPRAR
jgi:hypothetical protein